MTMVRPQASLLLVLTLLLPIEAARAQGLGQSALLYSGETSFFVQPPPGWRLDSEQGKSDGVLAAVYRIGESWRTGSAVMYAHTLPLAAATPRAFSDQLRAAEAEWRGRNARGEVSSLASIVSEDSSVAVIKRFVAAATSQFAVVAYFRQERAVPILVLSARTRAELDRAYPDFLRLVRSYGIGPTVKAARRTG